MTGFVIPEALATPDDLATWTGAAAPTNATAVLRSCTTLVLAATRGATYEVDADTGLATDPVILQTMQDATCIQAAAWGALGIDPLTGGIITSKVKKSQKLLTAVIEYADSAAAADARNRALVGLVPEAYNKLRQQNLISYWPASL